jgi:hypothetical protein
MIQPPMRSLPAVSMLLATAALASCDSQLPLQSDGRAVPSIATHDILPNAGGGGSQMIGTFSMPTPIAAAAGAMAGHQPVTSTGITLQPNTYVLLRVGGTVEMERNPWLPRASPGEVLLSYSAHESRQASGRGMTHVYMGFADITGSFRVDGGGRDVIRLVHIVGSSPVELRASRAGLPVVDMRAGGFCPVPYCSAGTDDPVPGAIYGYWVEIYRISQSHEITATQIDRPLWIKSSPLVPGAPVRAEAHLFGGLRLRDAAGVSPQINWVWYPGHPSAPTGETIALPQCFNSLVCEFTPDKPGRLRVWTTVEGSPVDVVEFLPAEESTPVLTCTPMVVRGETVTCSLTNATGVDVQEWKFVGETFANDPSLEISEPGPEKVWTGPAIEGGTVTVETLVNGAPQTFTSSFSVSNRAWKWGPADWSYSQGGAPVCDSTRPTHTATLNIGWNRNAGVGGAGCFEAHLHRWVLPDPVQTPNTGYTVEPVPSGPNRGRWYVTQASFRIDRASNMNPHWLPTGPEFRLTGPQVAECIAAGVTPPVRVNLYTFNKTCKGVDIDRFIAGVWGHEGFGYAGGAGHQGLGQGRAAEPGGDPLLAIEWFTRANEMDLREDVHNAVYSVGESIQLQSADESGNVAGNWPGGLLWVWNPTTRRYVQRQIRPL